MIYSQDLMCVRHCNQTIFSYDILTQCPLCGKSVGENLDSTPITLPCPFVRACQYPCSIVLRPSVGDFLSSFQNQTNLHIGLTSSNGTIVEFDVNGLTKIPPKSNKLLTDDWDQCLVIASVPESWHDRWDEVLEKISCDPSWSREMYQENTHNCYAFVLSFLSGLEYGEFYHFCHDKLSFSKQIIAAKTQSAAKYITIHRKLQTRHYFIEEQ
ncbi:MKRN2 opposite strand protein isoform X3 [Anopheles funestus]|uniref:MKRN2 opposite strand protein n=2 Tax=Anopheles funestus TaxID=62324 RepID=A0A182RBP7_ANOFN|nr:MKRN2 opposite strand protein isoform X3 [Anopheles funestus]XP_049282866.1 MKRN2 opposite strand protein isoform X3 [Anopheles funestus]XP_049282868.1 MKRN2 opposite strand protein isoform X3 [Anopheles funestus]